ncbi:hypothetical protein, partial [Mesomycoplasma ovipneumoniae]
WCKIKLDFNLKKIHKNLKHKIMNTPAFCSIYFDGLIAEVRITRQTQIIELFKILQRLNFSGNLITNILNAILKNWEDQFKNKDLELVTFADTPGEFYKSVFNDKHEPFPKGRIDF